MKNCLACGYEEKDSSLFCSNCGNSFETKAIFDPISRTEDSIEENSKIQKIFGIFVIVCLLFDVLIAITSGLSTILFFSLIATVTFILIYVKEKFYVDLDTKKDKNMYSDDMTKLGVILIRK